MSWFGGKSDKQEENWSKGQSMHDPAMDKVKSGGAGMSANKNPYALPAHMDDD